jgi:hypothetical protein
MCVCSRYTVVTTHHGLSYIYAREMFRLIWKLSYIYNSIRISILTRLDVYHLSYIALVARRWLFKKGGGTSTLGRRSWHKRWCRIECKILYVYNQRHDPHARNAIALDGAEVHVKEHPKHPFYFEIFHGYSETTFQVYMHLIPCVVLQLTCDESSM